VPKQTPPPKQRAKLPWYLVLPAVMCGIGVGMPVIYLLIRAFNTDTQSIKTIIFSARSAKLLGNTLLLSGGVLIATLLLAIPAAWLTARTNLRFRKLWSIGMVLPLAVPGYLMAFCLLSLGGSRGAVARLTDGSLELPIIRGFWGSLIALSLYNLPYMFLNVRAAVLTLDPCLEDAARALGRKPAAVFFRVVLPQLKPAMVAGGLLVCLHVVADFGVVQLMNYQTFSYTLFQQYESGNTNGAAFFALMMIALSSAFIGLELWLLRGIKLHRAASGAGRQTKPAQLGYWSIPATAFLAMILTLGVLVPTVTAAFWMSVPTMFQSAEEIRAELIDAMRDSVFASGGAAIMAVMLAIPIAYLGARYKSKRATLLERVSYAGYATPALAFALSLLVFTLTLDRLFVKAGETFLYGSLAVLIYAYALHFLAEAVEPVRAALYQATPRLEEAARALGRGPIQTIRLVTLPLLRPGIGVALVLVFLSAMKELPMTMLLKPYEFYNLAFYIFDKTREGFYAEAAPFALGIVGVSSIFVACLLISESGPRKK